jgi:hypothetical protein
MQSKRWIRRGVLALVWGLAVSTWASIGHYLFGLPDIGPIAVITTVGGILAWPLITQPGRRASEAPASLANTTGTR